MAFDTRTPHLPQTTIREVTADDVPAVVALVREVLAEFGIAFGEGSDTDKQLYDLPHAYTDVGGAFWVATAADDPRERILGTVALYPVEPDVLEVRKMYVLASARGLRLGHRLLETALTFAKAHGAKAVVLDTVHEMKQAIALYERHGFVRDDSQIRGSRCSRGYRLDL